MDALIINNTEPLWRYGAYNAIKLLVNRITPKADKGGLDIYIHNNDGVIKMMAQDFKKHTSESSHIGILPLTSDRSRIYRGVRQTWDELQLASMIRKYDNLTIIDYESYTGLTLSALYEAFKILSSSDFSPYMGMQSVVVKSLVDKTHAIQDDYYDRQRISRMYGDLMQRLAFGLNPRPHDWPDWSEEEYESWVREGLDVSLDIVYFNVERDPLLCYTFPERKLIHNQFFNTGNIRHHDEMK